MKISSYNRHRRGVVTLVSTVVICAFMLTLMTIAYRVSVRNLEGQKATQLSIDYETKDQAFLRAIVSLTPKYAANSMAEGSDATPAAGDDVSFLAMYTEAQDWAQLSSTGRDTNTDLALEDTLGVADFRNGNTGGFSSPPSIADLVGGVDGLGQVDDTLNSGETPSAVRTQAQSPDSNLLVLAAKGGGKAAKSSEYPLISSDLLVDTVSGSFGSDYRSINYPDISFQYVDDGTQFITRQHWWQMFLHLQSKDVANTGLGLTAKNTNEYILSLYEVPSQLAISSAATTNLGSIAGGAWDPARVSVTGSVYAKEAIVDNNSFTSLSTTDGATVQGSASVGGVVAGDGQTEKDTFEASNARNFYPISQASDYARSLFLPINPGIEFFDTQAQPLPTSSSRLSAEQWVQYSRGAHQCAMQVYVTATVASDALDADATSTETDQTPTEVQFTYVGSSATFSEGDGTLPTTETAGSPFYTSQVGNQPTLVIDMEQLRAYLQAKGALAGDLNHSLVVNTEYATSGIVDPQDDTFLGTHMAVVLENANDLSQFDNTGFSLVTNFSLYILSDVNQVSTGGTLADPEYPALSLYAPVMRFGAVDTSRSVTLRGSMGSVKKSGTANLLDLKAVGDADATAAQASQITATLEQINSVDDLPPIHMMNWLVVVQKKR